jgi:AraC-like DNA-binding protein
MKKNIIRSSEHISVMAILLIMSSKNEDFKDINVAWVARKLNVNYKYLSRSYVRECETPLLEFIGYEKLKRAFALLKRNPKIKTKKVAEILGYSSTCYFIKSFKKYFGYTPQFARDYFSYGRATGRKFPRK